jgi:phosphoribosylamine--glycine ligase
MVIGFCDRLLIAMLMYISDTKAMEIAILGHMGRDEALADRLSEHRLYAIGQWENPGLVDKVTGSGGDFYTVDSITNVDAISDIVEHIQPDMFITNFDDALAAGVVDDITSRVAEGRIGELLVPCPDKKASRIEWDKFYLRQLIDEIDPKYNPVNFMAESEEDVFEAIDYFDTEGIEIAVKPRNLTGGKGVKVMGKHFDTFEQAQEYTLSVIANTKQTGVEIQEKMVGHEFTLQLFTDGNVMIHPPATYDYPYREDGDVGPGTGGMGTFSMHPDQQLPFIEKGDYNEAVALMQKVLIRLKDEDIDYKGVLYPTFFKTLKGLKIVEINARGGDPELINILDLAEDDVDFGEVLGQISVGELEPDSVRYKKLASTMSYLVAPEYGYGDGPSYEFELDPKAIAESDCRLRFAAAERIGENRYRTVGTSRTVGMLALGNTPWEARDKINEAIESSFGSSLPLDYRKQIGKHEYIQSLSI